MIKYHLSDYAKKSLIPSAVNEMTEAFALDFREGTDINLGVGYVNDKTIPSASVASALKTVLENPSVYRNALNYGAAEGSPNLLRSIREFFIRNSTGSLTEKTLEDKAILTGANGATSLLESLAQLFKPGIIITTEPCYYIYTEFLERIGHTVIGVPEQEDGIDIENLKKTLSAIDLDKIRFIYCITVNNPTGTIISNKKRQQLIEIAEELTSETDYTIPVVFDRAYEDIIYDASVPQPKSALLYDTQGLAIEIGTLSKILAPALRIGYLIARKSTLTQVLTQRISDIGFSAPLITQEIASVLLDNHIDQQIASVKKGYKEKAIYLRNLLDTELGNYISSIKGGQAGFYFYIQFSSIKTGKGSHFHNFLSRTTGNPNIDGFPEKHPRLIYIPGEICTVPHSSIAESAACSLRISFGFEETNVLQNAVMLLRDAAKYSIGKN